MLIQQHIQHIFTFHKPNIITTATHTHTQFFSIYCWLCYPKRQQTYREWKKVRHLTAENRQPESQKYRMLKLPMHQTFKLSTDLNTKKSRIITQTCTLACASQRARSRLSVCVNTMIWANAKSKLQCNWIQNKLKRVKSFRTGIVVCSFFCCLFISNRRWCLFCSFGCRLAKVFSFFSISSSQWVIQFQALMSAVNGSIIKIKRINKKKTNA